MLQLRLLAFVGMAAGALAQASLPALQQVYDNGQFGWPCYRQPVLKTFGSTVLAFVEGRNNTCCWGRADGYPKAILLRRSTDGGSTFGDAQQLWIGGPDFFVAARDEASGLLSVLIQEGGSVLSTTSSDDGATWTKPAPLKLASDFQTFKPSVGHAIQLDAGLCGASDGPAPSWHGRIVVPWVCAGRKGAEPSADIACSGCYSCLLLSDDGGKTWRGGAVSPQEGTREPSVVQVCSPRSETSAASGAIVFMSERNMGKTAGHRAWAESADAGETVTSSGIETAIVAPVTGNWTGVVGAVERTGGVVAYSGPLRGDARAVLGVRASRDEARSWSAKAQVVWPGPAAYSDMQPYNRSHLAVIFEAGKDHFAEGIKLAAVQAASLP